MLLVTGAGISREIKEAACALGVKPLCLPPYAALPSPVSAHADLLIHPLCGTLYTSADYYYRTPGAREAIDSICRHAKLELAFIKSVPGDKYPADVPLCARRVGEYFIANPQASPELFAAAQRAGLKAIAVKQGYAACSTAAVGDNAVITADPGITHAAHAAGLDVLNIQPGHIDLPGYGYGFIGGAYGFCAARGEAWFCGDPLLHPDGERMLSFIKEHGFKPVLLASGRLFDCGGIFFF